LVGDPKKILQGFTEEYMLGNTDQGAGNPGVCIGGFVFCGLLIFWREVGIFRGGDF